MYQAGTVGEQTGTDVHSNPEAPDQPPEKLGKQQCYTAKVSGLRKQNLKPEGVPGRSCGRRRDLLAADCRYGSESLSCCFPLVAVGCPAAQRPRDFWEKALPRGETKLRVGTVERGGEISLPGCERSFSLRSPGTAWTAVQDGIGQGTMHPEAPELGGGASGEWEVPRCVLGQRS